MSRHGKGLAGLAAGGTLAIGLLLGALPLTAASASTPTVMLAASATTVPSGSSVTLSATSSESLASTPDAMEIVAPGGVVLNTCQSTPCTASVTNTSGSYTYVAEIIDWSNANAVVATSAPVTVTWTVPTVDLSADRTVVQADQPVTLSATPSQDLTLTPYAMTIALVDSSTGTVLATCKVVPCTATVVNTHGTYSYDAQIIDWGNNGQVVSTSAPVSVTWTYPTIRLWANPIFVGYQQPTTLTAVASEDLMATPYALRIVDEVRGIPVMTCKDTPCAVSVTSSGWHVYVAQLIDWSNNSATVETSWPVLVFWLPSWMS